MGVQQYGSNMSRDTFDPYSLLDFVNSDKWKENLKKRAPQKFKQGHNPYNQAEHIKKTLWESEKDPGVHIPLQHHNRGHLDET